MISFKRPDGQDAPAYYAAPANPEGTPGVVLLEEWWGVTDHIKRVADDLASNGFRVVLPDFYRGRTAAVGDEANHLAQGLDFADAAGQDARGAAQYLKQLGCTRVGVLGFCMGGALAFLSAMTVPEFDAAVTFYGYTPPEAGDSGEKIAIPIQGHWATDDEHFPIARVDDIEASLRKHDKPYEFYRYDAKHGFHNPNPVGSAGLGHYNAAYAKLAWERTVAFLKKQLG